MIICNKCNKEYKNDKAIKSHMWKAHTEAGRNLKPRTGVILSNDIKEKISNSLKGKPSGAKGKKFPGRVHSDELNVKISEGMKLAHKEGRAHNIGKSRWNNKPSWPEQWFMNVIENEFEDKNYQKEYPFYKYSLDFIWIHKKKVIEIDGDQHDRFEEQKRRDNEKDNLLKKDGYQLLRIKWKDICNNSKKFVEKLKNFIDN